MDTVAQKKYKQRQLHALPHWEKFIVWTKQLIKEGVQHGATRDALQYLLNHAPGLQRYCEDGRLPMSNLKVE